MKALWYVSQHLNGGSVKTVEDLPSPSDIIGQNATCTGYGQSDLKTAEPSEDLPSGAPVPEPVA